MTSIGIIGCGSIGQRHADNFRRLGCVVWTYDPIIPLMSDEASWCLASECDGVVVACPTAHHAKTIREIDRPMLVEKPICATASELDLVLGHANKILMVGYNLRFHSCVKKAREWLGKGAIGHPMWARFVCAQYNIKPAYRRDGVILNWSHEIDLALHLLGAAHVKSCAINGPIDESLVDIVLQHEFTNCQASIHLDYVTRPERRGFTIVGTHGSLDADLVTRQAYIKNLDGKIIHAFHGMDTFDDNYQEEAAVFLDMIRAKPNPFTDYCDAKQAIAVAKICFAAKEAAK